MTILQSVVEIKQTYLRKYNEILMSNNPKLIKACVRWLHYKMQNVYYTVAIIGFFLQLFCWYYVIAFCAIYTKSSVNWFLGGLTTLIIDLIIMAHVYIILHCIFRYLAKKWYLNKYYLKLYELSINYL